MEYEVVIGLEIHAELKTKTKVFCSCKNSFGDKPNTNCCPVCVGFPGALPVINKEAIKLTIKAGLALGCKISEVAVFERKNYFYPDLAKVYQISQLVAPICLGGGIRLDSGKFIRLNRIHLEEDAGKLIHKSETIGTYIDYNRGGVPLDEIVTEPDISSANEAVEFLTKLRRTLIFAEVADCRMEQGGMRCDVNLSVKPKGSNVLGVRTEMKNLNSFKMVERAIKYEANRQIELLSIGEKIRQETRKWDDNRGKSLAMRSKEEAQDYRYFKDPDIPPIHIRDTVISQIKCTLPPLPLELKEKFMRLGLSEYDANILISEKEYAKYFENLVELKVSPKLAANFIITDLLKIIKEDVDVSLCDIISVEDLATIISKLEMGEITLVKARQILNECKFGAKDVKSQLLKLETLITDEDSLSMLVNTVLKENQEAIKDYATNPNKVINFFVGKIMKMSHGQANAELARKILLKSINHYTNAN